MNAIIFKKVFRLLMGGTLLIGLAIRPALSQEEQAATTEEPAEVINSEPEATGFQAFALIASNNIFDPNRRPDGVRRPPVTEGRPPQLDRLEFVGTLIDANEPENSKAFFKSTVPQLQKALSKEEEIIEYTLLDIEPTKLRLQLGEEEPFEFERGQQFVRSEGEDWEITDNPQPFGDRVTATRNTRAVRTPTRQTSTPTTTNTRNSFDFGGNTGNTRGGRGGRGGGRTGNNGGFGGFGGGGGGGRGGFGGGGNAAFGQDPQTPALVPAVTVPSLDTSGASSSADILELMRARRASE